MSQLTSSQMGRLVERVDFQEEALDSLRDHVEECALGVSKVIYLTADSEDEVDKAKDLPVVRVLNFNLILSTLFDPFVAICCTSPRLVAILCSQEA